MIPGKTHPSWRKLVRGEIEHAFSVYAGSMIISRLSRMTALDSSPETLEACIDEAHEFFSRNEALFVNDLKGIFGKGVSRR